MKLTYSISGMTCGNCKNAVNNALKSVNGVNQVEVDLINNEVIVTTEKPIETKDLQNALPSKYKLSDTFSQPELPQEPSKIVQLRPLFLILLYISAASILINRTDLNYNDIMLDFMGLFFIVFSFFKILDVKGFASTFSLYDPIAKLIPFYANVYPFIEIALGLMFLFRYNVSIALVATIIILGFTTVGVSKILLSNQKIKCACLGTALNLPMTEATFIENALMIAMSVFMLFS